MRPFTLACLTNAIGSRGGRGFRAASLQLSRYLVSRSGVDTHAKLSAARGEGEHVRQWGFFVRAGD